jgi:starch-binding outer membrane protein, SusD/RagB family
MNIKNKYVFFIILVMVLTGCKKLVDVDPPVDKQEGGKVYASDAAATTVLTGIYIRLNDFMGFASGFESISVIGGLSADELTAYNASGDLKILAYKNALTSAESPGVPFWNSLYFVVYTTNSALEGISVSNTLTPAIKQQLLGEAKFMRGLCYFYLTNLWGDVPLVMSTNYKGNLTLKRNPQSEIYTQIIKDLKEAEEELSDTYLLSDIKTETEERGRPTKWAAKALLARVYLYLKDYQNAQDKSSEVIDHSNVYDTVSIENVFLKNNKEAIWQILPTENGWNTNDARVFILTASPNYVQPVSISNQLLNAFDNNDKRKSNWIASATFDGVTYHYPYKYKANIQFADITEYLTVLRLAEQYLIRAEARTFLADIAGAQTDINIIRKRAGLINTSANDEQSLVKAIEKERQLEFFAEWGHRWLDLKRTDRINEVMGEVTPLKGGGAWNVNKALYPISYREILYNPLIKQNPGYN